MPHSLDLSDKTALLHQQMYGIPQRDFRSWCAQRDDALAHHIPFRFSLLQWRLWWLHEMGGADVRIKQRFRAGHCVMVRIGGRGAYEPGNVRCVVRDGDGPDVPLPVKDGQSGLGLIAIHTTLR